MPQTMGRERVVSATARMLVDEIVASLRDRIISGTSPCGTPIDEAELGRRFGVGVTDIREALVRLEQDGLVVGDVDGFIVRPLSADEAYDVFDLRRKIEPDAVVFASGRLTQAHRARVRSTLDALNEAMLAETPQAAIEVGALNRAYHMELIRPGGRPITMRMIERLQVIAERYVVKHLEPSGRTHRAIGEHEALYTAWASGESDMAGALSAAHIANTLRDLRVELDKLDN